MADHAWEARDTWYDHDYNPHVTWYCHRCGTEFSCFGEAGDDGPPSYRLRDRDIFEDCSLQKVRDVMDS